MTRCGIGAKGLVRKLHSKNSKRKKINGYNILYYCSLIAIPNIFVFNIYNQNSIYIQFSHTLILAAIATIVSIIIGAFCVFLTRTFEGSFMLMLVMWLIFWFFETLARFVQTNIPLVSRAVLWVLIFILLLSLTILFRRLIDKPQEENMVFTALFATTILVFLLNALPSAVTAISQTGTIDEWRLRKDFNVSNELPNPDIYWFHIDGMLSLNTIEYFSGHNQDKSRKRLLDLGFVINEDAEIFTSNTFIGVPALLSPDFYDSYLHQLFMEGQHLLLERRPFYYASLESDGISLENDLAPYHEFIHAFLQAGYSFTMIADFSPGVFTVIDQFYRLDSDNPFAARNRDSERHFLVGGIDLLELLVMMTPLPRSIINTVAGNIEWQSIPEHEERINELTLSLDLQHERELYQALIDSLENQTEAPKLTYITLMFSHGSGWEWFGESGSVIQRYLPAHEYALEVMFNMFDLILDESPNAIIVVQADHGIHWHWILEELLDEGFSLDEVLRMYNSVISAVRIPDQYGQLEAPLAPLNIARELVNRFVGQNYELLLE